MIEITEKALRVFFSKAAPSCWGRALRLKNCRFPLVSMILALLWLTLPIASAGCTSFGGSGPLVDVMKKVPLDSTSFDYWCIEKLAEDEDLWGIYLKFRDESLEASQLKDMEVRLSSVKHAAKASGFDGSVGVFVGDFATKIIGRRLEDEGYQKTTYQATEIWTPQDGQGYESVALRQGTILTGDVENLKACIDTIVDEQEYSLYEDPDIRLVADKLPEGVIVTINKAGSDESYADLISYGKSYGKKDEGRLKLTAIYIFQDSYAAGEARDEIEGYLETRKFTDIKVEREGSFIRAKALIYITDFAQTLAF